MNLRPAASRSSEDDEIPDSDRQHGYEWTPYCKSTAVWRAITASSSLGITNT
jgi:hypothetical protein